MTPDATVDLDALRAKRLETAPERAVTFGGRDWELVAEVPFEVAEAYRRGDRRRAFQLLLADMDETDEFMALRPSTADFFALLGSYDVSPGESPAS